MSLIKSKNVLCPHGSWLCGLAGQCSSLLTPSRSLPETPGYDYISCMETDEQWITHRWQKGNRYYVAELMQDLFGAWILKRTWGSIQTYRGHSMTLSADNYEHALKLLRDVEKWRKTRGYTQTA